MRSFGTCGRIAAAFDRSWEDLSLWLEGSQRLELSGDDPEQARCEEQRGEGVLGDAQSHQQDSFEDGLLDCPHFSRPELLAAYGEAGQVPLVYAAR